MERKSVKEGFIKQIYTELQDYKDSILVQERAENVGSSYKFEILSALYEILLEKADSISDTVLLNLLGQSTGILEIIYQDWLKKDVSFDQELSEHVDSEFEDGLF